MPVEAVRLSIRKRTKKEMYQHIVDYYEDRGAIDWSKDVMDTQIEKELNKDPSFAYAVKVETKNPLLDNMFNNSTVLTVGKLADDFQMFPKWLNTDSILDVLCEKENIMLFLDCQDSRKLLAVSIAEKKGTGIMFNSEKSANPGRAALYYLVAEAEKLNGNDNPTN